MKDTDTSCQVVAPNIEKMSSMSSKTVMNTRNIQAAGSTRQSIRTSQMYTQNSNPCIRAYQKLMYVRTATFWPLTIGNNPRNWSAWIAARTAAMPARIARIVTPMGRSFMK